MRKTVFFFLAFASMILFSACNSNENQIRKIAFGYLDAMGNYRISEAYPYATQETQESTLKYIEEFIMPRTDTNYLKSETPATITITNISITSDTTATVMFHKSTPSSERNNILNMVKRNGEWRANVAISVPPIMKNLQNGVVTDTTAARRLILKEVDLDTINSGPRIK